MAKNSHQWCALIFRHGSVNLQTTDLQTEFYPQRQQERRHKDQNEFVSVDKKGHQGKIPLPASI